MASMGGLGQQGRTLGLVRRQRWQWWWVVAVAAGGC